MVKLRFSRAFFCMFIAASPFCPHGEAAAPDAVAAGILDATGVKGGFIVHLGCGDGRLTVALAADEGFLVQGLAADAADVTRARNHIRSRNLYGRVTAERLAGNRLPYIDNLVNLIVVTQAGQVSEAEMMRVLAPRGVAYLKRKGEWIKKVKPVPPQIDEWTHYLYDATNNAVSKDKTIAPLKRMQWLGSPRWSRHHDHMSSLSSLVTSKGRLFYIFDEGSTASIVLPSRWYLIARDAFNGTILWKKPIDRWFTQLWPLKSGPALLTRRLVAVDDTVYVTLGLDAPVTALEAATGELVKTYEGTGGTDEIIYSEGVLFLGVNRALDQRWGGSRASVSGIKKQVRGERWADLPASIMALQADTGDVLWRHQARLSPSTLSADGRRVYFHDGEKVVSLKRTSGDTAWTSESLPMWSRTQFQSWFVPCLVLYEDVVLWAGGEAMIPHRGGKDSMTALDARTGRKLWSKAHAASGYQSAEDLLVAGGLVWTGATTSGGYDGIFSGYDPRTGELKKRFPPNLDPYWFHHRCYRGKATEDYLLMSRTGIEFLDLEAEDWTLHHWVRGACLTGILPANGMVYATPHDCACYPEAKVYGFAAMAPEGIVNGEERREKREKRLEKGPAYGKVEDILKGKKQLEWPTYRGGAARHGYTQQRIPANLQPKWTAALDGPLSSVTVAGGLLFVASIDQHIVHARCAETGEAVWHFDAGGRVDSPPTIWKGHCLFGAADGYVYCLRASDGELAWRFRAAPVDQRQTVFEQIESVWPVHGSILIEDDAAWFVAGRSMLHDGGMHFFKLDPATGKILLHRLYDENDPESGKHLQDRHQTLQMPVALSDILSSDGKRLYMRSQVIDKKGTRHDLGPHTGDLVLQATVQRGETAHLFAPYGFLDSSWFHRSYWVFGRSFSGGHGGYYQAGKFAPAGRLLVADEQKVYGYGRKPQYLRWTTPLEYHLFSTDREAPKLPDTFGKKASSSASGSFISVSKSESLNPAGKSLAVEAWVKATKANGVVLARGGPSHGYALHLKKGRPRFAVCVEGKQFEVEADQRIVNQWVHLAGVLTGEKKLKLYIDGKSAGSRLFIDGNVSPIGTPAGFIASDPAQALEIGADADTGEGVGSYSGHTPFTGLIDEVRVYHGKVAAAEIARHAADPAALSTQAGKLVLHFTFEASRANTARDRSGNKNHGAFSAMVKSGQGPLGKAMSFTGRAKGAGPSKSHFVEYAWSVDTPPIAARAMLLAGNTLFAAGPPDVLDEDSAVGKLSDDAIQRKLIAQDASLKGEIGGRLIAMNSATGERLGELTLPAPPAWDSLAAAYGRLYLATTDGELMCLEKR